MELIFHVNIRVSDLGNELGGVRTSTSISISLSSGINHLVVLNIVGVSIQPVGILLLRGLLSQFERHLIFEVETGISSLKLTKLRVIEGITIK